MAPLAIDEDQMRGTNGVKQVVALDPAKPPVKTIPYLEYPRVVYKHPKDPYRVVEHRNTQHEIVQVERIPSEHISKLVNDERELAAALKDGWVKEPYVAAPAPDPNEHLYDEQGAEELKPSKAKAAK